jgi:hypothetical protein
MATIVVDADPDDCRIPPRLDHRWLHGGAQHLSLLSTPLTQAKTISYVSFSNLENLNLEIAFNALSPGERKAAIKKMGEWKEAKKETNSTGTEAAEKKSSKPGEIIVGDSADPDQNMPRKASLAPSMDADNYPDPDSQPILPAPEEDTDKEDYDDIKGVSVAQVSLLHYVLRSRHDLTHLPLSGKLQDGLFEVDLREMSLYPVFWAHTGARVPVHRATWFIGDETKPCDWALAEELERGYQ